MANKILGINFGVNAFDIVEMEKNNIIRNFHVDYEDKEQQSIIEVTDEIKLTALLQKTLNTKKIETKEVVAALPSEEVLLRSFLIPPVTKNELQGAVEFEARKFIPFRLEELYFDFVTQKFKDPKLKRLKTSFAGMKKETLEKFQYILEQSNLKILSLEPASFSLLRLFLYKKIIKREETISIIEISQERGSICIIEKGCPQLIRDFKFRHMARQLDTDDVDNLIARLKNEIHVSFDYYNRQFSRDAITKIFFFASDKFESAVENVKKELDIPVVPISEYLELKSDFDFGAYKAYAAALRQTFRSQADINLLRKRDVLEEKPRIAVSELPIDVAMLVRTSIVAVLFVAFIFTAGSMRVAPLKSRLAKIEKQRLQLDPKFSSATIPQLDKLKIQYENEMQTLTELKQDRYVTPLVNALPRLIPQGVWVENFDFSEKKGQFSLRISGNAYSKEKSEEIRMVNAFVSNLQNNAMFAKKFNQIKLGSVSQGRVETWTVSRFLINCK
ncbi:pilus assembly protein PilM [Candidatus Omnitrophota bacterium]